MNEILFNIIYIGLFFMFIFSLVVILTNKNRKPIRRLNRRFKGTQQIGTKKENRKVDYGMKKVAKPRKKELQIIVVEHHG